MTHFHPTTTYRIQLSPRFTFSDLGKILPYLEEMGISTIYAAPIFEARSGSSHGYDITNPHRLNPEIGSLEEWIELRREMRKRKISWLQDIVPNHMAFDSNNKWLQDIFFYGPQSRYYDFFDIDWDFPIDEFKGKLMAPFLGKSLNEVIEDQDIQVVMQKNRFWIRYYEHCFSMSGYSHLILWENIRRGIEEKKLKISSTCMEMLMKKTFDEKTTERIAEKILSEPELNLLMDENLRRINDDPQLLKEILDRQYFCLVPWHMTDRMINYRRFFTINGLIGLKQENSEVFFEYHKFIVELCQSGWIDGLRIDHIDGLYDPKTYLENLRDVTGDVFITVEKILAPDEDLPKDWPVEGNTGYDFLASVNQLFTNYEAEGVFTKEYQKRMDGELDFQKLAFTMKLWILENRMKGEFENLCRYIDCFKMLPDSVAEDEEKWQDILKMILCSFPVYRFYPASFPLDSYTESGLNEVYAHVVKRTPGQEREVMAIFNIFQGKSQISKDVALDFFRKSQQLTGALAAKGIEDSSFYIYHRLISHNEVGDDPTIFGMTAEKFHEKMIEQSRNFSGSINATASHDTKRGEDARMRINSLSFFPDEWFDKIHSWMRRNEQYRQDMIPDINLEYFIYQTLVGSWLPVTDQDEEYLDRTTEYLLKVLRESKEYSNWTHPEEIFEKKVLDFVRFVLADSEFRKDFQSFSEKIISCGAVFSLGQSLLKVTVPGIPDIYQGTELWDLSYVDPDNRRAVDFEKRKSFVQEFENVLPENRIIWLEKTGSEKLKMFVLWKALRFRRRHSNFFQKAEYHPVYPENREEVLAFVRYLSGAWILVVVTLDPDFMEVEEEDEKSPYSFLSLPAGIPEEWEDIFTGKKYHRRNKMRVSDLLTTLPVALLTNMEYENR